MRLLGYIGIFTLCAAPGRAQVLFLIDESNPDAITITATGAAPLTDVVKGAFTYDDGFDLTGFFGPSNDLLNLYDNSTSSTLTTGDSSAAPTLPLYKLAADNLSTGGGDEADLNIFHPDTPGEIPETFTSPSPAFLGTITFDLPALEAAEGSNFPLSGNATGLVYAGFSGSGSDPVEIGTYALVPEPRTWAMMLLSGLFLLVGARSFRRLA